MDGLVSCYVEKDGEDATLKLIDLINNCKFKTQLKAIFLDGIAVGGFNVINAKSLNKLTGIPVIVVMRDYPDFKKMYTALKNLGMEKKIDIIKKMPKPKKASQIYIQNIGLTLKTAREYLKISATHSYLPEPIRIAHLITQGIVMGESKGRA